MMWDGVDRRRFPRAVCRCRIRVSTDGEEVVDTFTENIGAGGVCVVLDKDFGLFGKVSLEMLPAEDEKPILCKGTIVWVVKRHGMHKTEPLKYDTGIEFLDISEEDRGRVSRLVEKIIKEMEAEAAGE